MQGLVQVASRNQEQFKGTKKMTAISKCQERYSREMERENYLLFLNKNLEVFLHYFD